MKHALLVLTFFLCGCSVLDRFTQSNATPATQTTGGDLVVQYNPVEETITVTARQPSNPDEAAVIEFNVVPGEYTTIPIHIRATTGSSREDKFAGLGLKLDSYKPFTYVGAAMCVVGIGVLIASFKIPLIPKMAGPIIFAGGGVTAYMATAIPEYGHYALGISLVGFVIWYYYQSAAKKDPTLFTKKNDAR